ncbi:ABC transporter permease [Pyrococcus sp. ST04]|uniref:ABC transporter permease n=1 Tax=Pyrococcus sp. ST04 TaxID=1183377 RepID=UPI00026058C1|nr:ABC transporter permease [Pyrococcus sp. ST04]AFK21654.1 ABC transporter ATP-binding protein [Pyrococcus sp. ST04]
MRARAIKGILVKEIKELSREKMAVFWIFIFPIIWLVILGGIWGGEGGPVKIKVGVVSYENSSILLEAMREVKVDGVNVFDIVRLNESEGLKFLKEGKVDALVILPEGFTFNLTHGFPAHVYVYFNKVDPQNYQIVRGTLQGFFMEFEKRLGKERLKFAFKYVEDKWKPYLLGLVEPIVVVEKEVKGEKVTPMEFYVTSFIGIQFLFATMLTISSSVLEEIDKGTLRRIASSPTSPWDFLTGKMLATFLVILASIVVGLSFAFIVFKVRFFPSPIGWLIIILGSIFSMSLGLTIAMLTGSIRTTTAVVNIVSMFLMFFAAVVIPESLLPSWARPISEYFPLGAGLKALRSLELYHRSIEDIGGSLLILGIGSIIALIIAVLSYKWRIKRLE